MGSMEMRLRTKMMFWKEGVFMVKILKILYFQNVIVVLSLIFKFYIIFVGRVGEIKLLSISNDNNIRWKQKLFILGKKFVEGGKTPTNSFERGDQDPCKR